MSISKFEYLYINKKYTFYIDILKIILETYINY